MDSMKVDLCDRVSRDHRSGLCPLRRHCRHFVREATAEFFASAQNSATFVMAALWFHSPSFLSFFLRSFSLA